MAIPHAALPYEDSVCTPEGGRRYEILDGELSVTSAPGALHQRIVRNLCALLDAHVREHALGEVLIAPITVVLASSAVVEPDLVYVVGGRAPGVTARAITGVPRLLVEVVSPPTRVVDRGRKLELYRRHGVPDYWIVETDERAIDAYELVDGAYRLALRAAGDAAITLPPFGALAFRPESLWRP